MSYADNNVHKVLGRGQSPSLVGSRFSNRFLINQPLSYEEKMPISDSNIQRLITHDLDVDSCREEDIKLLFRTGGFI